MDKKTILITGSAGFFGELLEKSLLNKDINCISVDIENNTFSHPDLTFIKTSILNKDELEKIFSQYKFDAIFHCASINPHAIKNKNLTRDTNVAGTKNIVELAKKYNTPKIIYLSTSAIWGRGLEREITESDIPNPLEIYGKSKLEAEKILLEHTDYVRIIIFRCPIIIDSGRLGLLSILFELIHDGCTVPLPNNGKDRVQYIYAQDLIVACIKALDYDKSDIFNIGSDNVKTNDETLNYLIKKAPSKSKIVYIPQYMVIILILLIKVANLFKLSPLNNYHCNMIGKNFILDTSKIKAKLNWSPTLTNEEMLYRAYEYYIKNIKEFKNTTRCFTNKHPAKIGVLRLLKLVS